MPDLDVSAQEYTDAMIMSGSKVEFYEEMDADLDRIVIGQIKKIYNPTIELVGILVTMFNGRINLSVQVMDELKKYYPDKLFSTAITRNVRLSEAPSYGEPIIYYDKYSKGSEAYTAVAKELIQRI